MLTKIDLLNVTELQKDVKEVWEDFDHNLLGISHTDIHISTLAFSQFREDMEGVFLEPVGLDDYECRAVGYFNGVELHALFETLPFWADEVEYVSD